MSSKNRPKDFIVQRPVYSEDKAVADGQKDKVIARLWKSFGGSRYRRSLPIAASSSSDWSVKTVESSSSERGYSLPLVLAMIVIGVMVVLANISAR